MSRTKRTSYPKTGKEIGHGEYTEEFRRKQKRGLVKNSIFDQETQEEIWGPKSKKHLKRKHSKKERRNEKQNIRESYYGKL